MKFLLDTHALLWWWKDQLSEQAKDALSDPSNPVYVSAATIWEMSIKAAAGKLRIDVDLLETCAEDDFTELEITFADATLAGSLPRHHGDPFDRMLVAQAMNSSMVLVTRDRALVDYGVPILWA